MSLLGGGNVESIYLKTFLEVVEAGSFTKAAENLCITQSAVSRRIKFMEVQYDCELLDRSDNLLTPTAYGKVVQEKAAIILSLEQDLLQGLKQVQPRKGLTFACTPTFGVTHLPKIQRGFASTQTDITDLNFKLENPEKILEGLNDGRYEVAVVEHCQDYELGDLQTIALSDDDVVFAAAPNVEIDPLEDPLDQLFQLVLYGRNDGCCSRKLLENNLTKAGRNIAEFRRIMAFDDLRTIIDALTNCDGVAFLSRTLIQEQLDAGELKSFHLPGFIHHRKRTLVFSEQLPQCNFGAPFIDQVLAHFELQTEGSHSSPHASRNDSGNRLGLRAS